MKSGVKRFLLAMAGVAVGLGLHAQDPQYTQFYANQPMLNPALTGAAMGPRVSMNYRAQWVAIPGSFRQMAFSYDQPMWFGKSLHGAGITIHSDRAGEGHLTKLQAVAGYSFALQFGRRGHEQFLRMGLSGGIEQASIDFYKLRFGDQIDQREGFIYATNEIPGETRINPDINAGLAYYNKYAWASASVHHLTQPQQLLVGGAAPNLGDTRLPMRIAVSGGLRIPAGPVHDRERVTVSPVIQFMKQRNFNQLNVGTYVGIDPLIVGLYWRTNYNNFNGSFLASDMIAGLVGFRQGIFSLGYSYDYTISRLTNGISGGSHELALVMEFERDKPNKFKHRKMPCPRF